MSEHIVNQLIYHKLKGYTLISSYAYANFTQSEFHYMMYLMEQHALPDSRFDKHIFTNKEILLLQMYDDIHQSYKCKTLTFIMNTPSVPIQMHPVVSETTNNKDESTEPFVVSNANTFTHKRTKDASDDTLSQNKRTKQQPWTCNFTKDATAISNSHPWGGFHVNVNVVNVYGCQKKTCPLLNLHLVLSQHKKNQIQKKTCPLINLHLVLPQYKKNQIR